MQQKALLEAIVLARLRPPLYVGVTGGLQRARACMRMPLEKPRRKPLDLAAVCNRARRLTAAAHFDHIDLPSSLNSAFHNARTAVGEPAQGVDSVGLFSVMFFI